MGDWVVETTSFEEDLMNNRVVMLNQNGVNKVVKIIKEKDKEIERLNNIWGDINDILVNHLNDCRDELYQIRKSNDLNYINECSKEYEVIYKNLCMIQIQIKELKDKYDEVGDENE